MASNIDNSKPAFVAIARSDEEFDAAYQQAAATLPGFIELLERRGDAIYSAKLRFRDPDESERLGEDRLAFIWLTSIFYYPEENIFSGVFFEVPTEFEKWHQVGQQLAFDPEDIFDWMILDHGKLRGGFTLRVSRSRLPESEREAYDHRIGVTCYLDA